MYQKVPPAPPLFPGDRRVNQRKAYQVHCAWDGRFEQRSPIRVDRRRRHGWKRILFCPPRRMMRLALQALRNGGQDLLGIPAA